MKQYPGADTTVSAYSYAGDVFCVDCTDLHYRTGQVVAIPDTRIWLDEHGIPEDAITADLDYGYGVVQAILGGEEIDYEPSCGACQNRISDSYPHSL